LLLIPPEQADKQYHSTVLSVRVQGSDKHLFFERSASIGGNNIGRWFAERRNSN